VSGTVNLHCHSVALTYFVITAQSPCVSTASPRESEWNETTLFTSTAVNVQVPTLNLALEAKLVGIQTSLSLPAVAKSVSVVEIFSAKIPIKLAPEAFVAGIRVAYQVVVLLEISTQIAAPSDIARDAFIAIFLNSHPVDEMGTKYEVVLGTLIGVTDCILFFGL
jgi:hypothetical protein